MLVHEFISGNKPVMVLLHGFLTPWQIWMPQIEAFKEDYNIYVVAFNAHTEEAASEFTSVSDEAEEIVQCFKSRNVSTVDVLCGLSLGGKIAYEIWLSKQLKIRNLILDGAPLVACPKTAVAIMTSNYINIVRKSKARDAKVIENFKKHFLPEKYLESYLKIADLITEQSVKNSVRSVFAGSTFACADSQSRVLFIHGTRGNEILSKRSAARLKKACQETSVICFSGDTHCYKALFQPEEWASAVKSFLDKG